MTTHGWNGGWLEIGLSRTEAVALLRILTYLADGTMRRIPIATIEERVADEAIHSMAHALARVVNARTVMRGGDYTYCQPPDIEERVVETQ